MSPTLIFVITLALTSLPLLYLLSVTLPTPRMFSLPPRLSARPHLTAAALYLPAIGFALLTDQYLCAGFLTVIAVFGLFIGAVAHRARRSAEADEASVDEPHTK